MNLLSVPEEVIEGRILPFLEWNDLLRFRRVCKTIHDIVKGYMKAHPELAPEIEINEKGRTFADFMKLDIPTTSLFLNNTSDLGLGLYEKQWKDASRFLRKYGPLIKSLRIKQMSLYVCDKELEFLEALVNLEQFEAGHYALGDNMEKAVIDNLKRINHHPPMVINYPVPEAVKRLKVLKIGRCLEKPQEIIDIRHPLHEIFVIGGGPLEYMTPPMGPEWVEANTVKRMALVLHFFVLEQKVKELEKLPGNLKVIDLVHHHDILSGFAGKMVDSVASVGSGGAFYSLLGQCAKNKVMLKNVGAGWLKQPSFPDHFDFTELGSVILSLVNLHPNLFSLDMVNLERIEIRQTSRSYVGTNWRHWRTGGRPTWPALKCLEVNVDSERAEPPFNYHSLASAMMVGLQQEQEDPNLLASTKVLFQFLFCGISRTNLTELRISFERVDGSLPIPKMEDVVASCPNLKKLGLTKWPGTNKALVTLWNGLPGLEEVSLEYSKNLGNVAFVGEDQRNPVFFKLKNLKKLSLKGLDQMPKITDTLFSLVIRHLSLTHFIVTSDVSVKSVTLVGVQSLLGSRFAETVYKFPFNSWSLDKTTSEEWKKLEMKFRSFEMF